MMVSTPRENGFSMPAEWKEHEGTWLQWPHNDSFEENQLWLENLWIAMCQALLEYENVHIAVTDEHRRENLHQQLSFYGLELRKIDIQTIPTNDFWMRDNGPIFVVNDRGELAVTDWNFNGWGMRYPFDADCKVPGIIADNLSVPLFRAPVVLEGGAIEVNGKGTMIATRSSMINPNRNPGKSQDEIEEALEDYLGITNVIWLSGAPREFCDSIGDETDLHIDLLARFVDESTVLYTWTDDESDPFFPYLRVHKKELEQAVTESGDPLILVPLLVPNNDSYSIRKTSTQAPFESKPALAAYTNFYVANGIVLMPVYGDLNDAIAKRIIAEHFDGREILGLPAHLVAELGGMMHCVTQQQPAVINK
jgi:agmatine deiminase